jgi:hypothetical protein
MAGKGRKGSTVKMSPAPLKSTSVPAGSNTAIDSEEEERSGNPPVERQYYNVLYFIVEDLIFKSISYLNIEIPEEDLEEKWTNDYRCNQEQVDFGKGKPKQVKYFAKVERGESLKYIRT